MSSFDILEKTVLNLGPVNANLTREFIVNRLPNPTRDKWRKLVEKATKDTKAVGLLTYLRPYHRGGMICSLSINQHQYEVLINEKSDVYQNAASVLAQGSPVRCEILFNATIHFELGFIFYLREISDKSASASNSGYEDNLSFSKSINNSDKKSGWTTANDQKLLAMLEQDLGISNIATQLRCSPQGIVRRMLDLGVIDQQIYSNIIAALKNVK